MLNNNNNTNPITTINTPQHTNQPISFLSPSPSPSPSSPPQPSSSLLSSDPSLKHFELLYSPRTEYSSTLETEEALYNDLSLNFDPITIKIIKKHFKEHLGSLNKVEFISILKNHLLSWHQELPHRELFLIKYLSRLFNEIDLNDNGTLEWTEFTNYIIHNSNTHQKNKNNPAYRLRFYYAIKPTIDAYYDNNKETIGHAFYIEKHNLLGIVQEGKSVIHFYNGSSFKKLKTFIDLKEIQKEIDELEMREYDARSEENLRKERLEYIKKMELKKQDTKHKVNYGLGLKGSRLYNKPWQLQTTTSSTDMLHTTTITTNNANVRNSISTRSIFSKTYLKLLPKKKAKVRDDEPTPEKVKRQIEKINNIKYNIHINKQLTVISTCFINEYDVLLVSANNKKICAWQYVNDDFKNVNTSNTDDIRIEKNYFKCAIMSSTHQQCTIIWNAVQRQLYTGQHDGKILKWNLTTSTPLEAEELCYDTAKSKKQSEIDTKNKFIPNKDEHLRLTKEDMKYKQIEKIPGRENIKIIPEKRNAISCLCLLGKLQLLAASYLNGHIILWDPLLKEYRKYYFDQSTAVYFMVYDPVKNILITGGFEHDIYIYDPYIDNAAVYKLKGHNWSISGIAVNVKDSEIISVDCLGVIKVWDSSTFMNFQTINTNETADNSGNTTQHNNVHGYHHASLPNDNIHKQKLNSHINMLYVSKLKQLLIYGSKLLLYKTDKSINPNLADDQIILACYYEKITKSIVSFCLRNIKIWNIFTGKIKTIYEDPMNNEVTALAVDKNMRRVFLGDNAGKIKNFNMKNGNVLKELEAHNSEIRFICHSLTLNIVVSCSRDNVIKIHDDKEVNESDVKKEITIHNGQVKAVVLCEKFARIVIGLSSGLIRFYDIEHLRYDSDLRSDVDKKENYDEITSLACVDGYEIIFATHLSGRCEFIVGPPSSMKYYEIVSFINDDNSSNSNKQCSNTYIKGIPITFSEFDYTHKLMFIGDQLGYIKCYDLSELYTMIAYGKEHSRNDNDIIITLEVIQAFPKMNIPLLWNIHAHNESIKHLHYVNITPNILISTSNDLKVRIFNASTGKLQDELKQISCKYKPVPIGIKYHVSDPFKSKHEQEYKEYTLMRSDVSGSINSLCYDDIDNNNQISDYSKKVTEYNAREKLYEHVKGTKLKDNRSNNWELDIDINKVKLQEQEELNTLCELVKAKEGLIKQTEMFMQKESIYSEAYRPQFVSEMDDEHLQEFSSMLSQKLRQVKLAISKANLSQNKYMEFEKEKKRKEKIIKQYNTSFRQKCSSQPSHKKRSALYKQQQQQQQHETEYTSMNKQQYTQMLKQNSIPFYNSKNNNTSLTTCSFSLSKLPKIDASTINQTLSVNNIHQQQHNSINNYTSSSKGNTFTLSLRKQRIQKYLQFINEPLEIHPKQSQYAYNKRKKTRPEDMFIKNSTECNNGYNEVIKACEVLGKKIKNKSKLTNTISNNTSSKIYLNILSTSQEYDDADADNSF